MRGRLLIVATPIGNLGDLSPRAAEALREASLWLVEDTRVSGKLQAVLGMKRPMRVVNEHTEDHALHGLLEDLGSETWAVLSDAGAPGISDPGARLVDLAYEHGVGVDATPGPSAVTDALMLSGFYAQRFAFLGFLGRKAGAIRSEFQPFSDSPYTLVLFESPFRMDATLQVAAEILGDRRYSICRELTKLHQQVYRGRLPQIPDEVTVPRKGEVTIVLEGRRRGEATRADSW